MITFQGSYLHPVFVKKRCSLTQFKDCQVAFVELNPSSSTDLRMLNSISSDWQDGTPGGTYATEICESFNNAYLHTLEAYDNLYFPNIKNFNDRFFAITSQKQDFDNLNPENTLAVVKITKKSPKLVGLEFLQVNPNHNYNAEYPNYKRVGAAIIDSLKSLFKGNRIEVSSDYNAISFYEKQGFLHPENGKPNQLYINV